MQRLARLAMLMLSGRDEVLWAMPSRALRMKLRRSRGEGESGGGAAAARVNQAAAQPPRISAIKVCSSSASKGFIRERALGPQAFNPPSIE